MEEQEYNEEVEEIDSDNTDVTAKEQFAKLNEYVQQMAYKPTKPYIASERTEFLSKAPKKYIVGTYAEHKDNFKPKERSNRIGRIVQNHKLMNIENLEVFIRKHRKKQAKIEKDKKQQQINYHETLLKLQKQCENQLMNAIVHKFAKIVSKKACCLTSPLNVETESYKSLQNSLVCEMILALKVPNEQLHQSKDLIVYKKLAAILAYLILQALFLAHNLDEQYCAAYQEQEQLAKPTERDLVIKFRALRAAKKKLYQSRQKSSRGYAVLSHRLDK